MVQNAKTAAARAATGFSFRQLLVCTSSVIPMSMATARRACKLRTSVVWGARPRTRTNSPRVSMIFVGEYREKRFETNITVLSGVCLHHEPKDLVSTKRLVILQQVILSHSIFDASAVAQ